MARLATALVFSFALASPSLALAQQRAQTQSPAAEAPPAPTTPPYMTKIQNGLRLAVARDFNGALASLREALQENPSSPEAYYYIGEVQRMQGNLDEALESFRTSATTAQSANAPEWRMRALAGVAATLEQKENQIDAARTAWNEAASFADANRAVANPEIARARIQAIDTVTEQERAYVAVRERIAARERENAQGNQGNRQNRQGGGGR